MGVLNTTPDSFSDGGRYLDAGAAVSHGLRMLEEGARIIDVGGESTRPGSQPVTLDEEIRRVVPVIERLRRESTAVISIDTSKPEVMRAAADAGAGLINDVRALTAPGALETAASTGCAVCLMHMKGEPRTMQDAPTYGDVVNEVKAFLHERVQHCLAAGVSAGSIAIDPGFGFGKTVAHNLELLRRLAELAAPVGAGGAGSVPVMVGLSRKSMIGRLTGRPAGERLNGSVVLAVMAVLNGASIVRVHDVAETVDALKIVFAVQGAVS